MVRKKITCYSATTQVLQETIFEETRNDVLETTIDIQIQ